MTIMMCIILYIYIYIYIYNGIYIYNNVGTIINITIFILYKNIYKLQIFLLF